MKRFLVLISVFLALCACKTQSTLAGTAHYPTIGDSRTIIRDTVMQHDSIYVHEFMQGDTVYVTKYRDRWRDKVVNRTDTVYVQADNYPQSTIHNPHTRDRPSKFYKNCTRGFWILLLCLLGNVGFRILRIFVFRR